MKILSVLILMASTSELMSESYATLAINESAYSIYEDIHFDKSAYDFFYESAFIAQGSYSGIKATFRTSEANDEYHELILFVPSHGEFQVGYRSTKGEYELKVPSTPFAFRAEETAGVTDRFDRPRPLMVEVSRWKRVASDQVSSSVIQCSSKQGPGPQVVIQ